MQIALDDFLNRVKSIEGTIELRDSLVAFGRVSPGDLDPTTAALHRSVRRIGLSGMQPSLDGSVLLIAAAFEQFVADAMIAFTENLPVRVSVYEELPNGIRSANERFTGAALSDGRSRSRFSEYELRRFVDNLRDCQAGVVPYVLNGEAIALNDRNLNARRLRELIGRLGIADIWTIVGSTRTLKRWSGLGGAKAAESRAKNQLNELITNRNQIAHRVGSTTIGPEVVRSYIRFQRALARSLVKSLEGHAASFGL